MKKIKILLVAILSSFILMPNVYAEGINDEFCLKSAPMWQIGGYALFALKIAVPLLIIILGTIDFAKGSFDGGKDSTTTPVKKLIIRLIIGVSIFVLPTIISIILSTVSDYMPQESHIEGCQVCLLRPTSDDCKSKIAEAKNSIN